AGQVPGALQTAILRFGNAPGRTPSPTRAFELSGDLLLQSRCVGLRVELRSIDGARISLSAFCLLGHWQSSQLGLTVQSIASEMQRGWTSLNFEPAVQLLWWRDACGSAALWRRRFSRASRDCRGALSAARSATDTPRAMRMRHWPGTVRRVRDRTPARH